jgi:putative membrane protein
MRKSVIVLGVLTVAATARSWMGPPASLPGPPLSTPIAAAAPSVGQGGDQSDWNWRMHDGWGDMMGWGGGMFGGIGMLLFWGAIIVLAVLIVRYFAGGERTQPPPQSAIRLVRARHPQGALRQRRVEYEQMKKTLMA